MKKIHWTDGQPLYPETLHAWEHFHALAATDRWLAVGGRKGFLRFDANVSPNGESLRVMDLLYFHNNGESICSNDLVSCILEIPSPRQIGALCQVVLFRADDEYSLEPHSTGMTPHRYRDVMVWNSRWRLAVRSEPLTDESVILWQWQANGEHWVNDADWVPPVLRTDGHPIWRTLMQTLEQQVASLADNPQRERLQRLWPALRQCDPFTLYLESMAALALTCEYSASDPGSWIASLFGKIRSITTPSTQSQARCHAMQAWDDGCYMINLKGKIDARNVGLILSIRVGSGEAIPNVGQIRVAALSRLPRVLRMSLPGAELLPESGAPNECRLRIARRGELWEQIVQEEMLGVFCGESKPYWSMVVFEDEQ